MRKVLSCFGLAMVLSVAPSSAATILLNFDTDFNSDPIPDGTLINTAYPSADYTFGADDTIRQGGGGVMSQPNFAAGHPTGFSSPIDVFFSNLASTVSAFNVTNSSYTLSVYDSADNLLGSASCAAFPCQTSLTFANQIARAQFSTTSQFGIDDLFLDYNAASVPEPASMLLLGTGLLGYGVRRRFLS